MLSGSDLCVGLITRPEEPYQGGVSECGSKFSTMRRPWPTGGGGRLGLGKKKKVLVGGKLFISVRSVNIY